MVIRKRTWLACIAVAITGSMSGCQTGMFQHKPFVKSTTPVAYAADDGKEVQVQVGGSKAEATTAKPTSPANTIPRPKMKFVVGQNPLAKPITLFGVSSDSVKEEMRLQGEDGVGVDYVQELLPPDCCTEDGLPWAPPGIARPWPLDEYIFDGGDGGVGVRVDKDWSVRGLEPDDTIAHYDTLDGKRLVEPSNRVPIYAPRFASVRKIYGIAGNENTERLSDTRDTVAIVEGKARDFTSSTMQQLQARGQVGSKNASTFRDRTRGVMLENQVASSEFNNRFSAFEDTGLIRYGIASQHDKAVLAEGIQAAQTWNENIAVQVVIENVTAATVNTPISAGAVYGVEEMPSKPKIRVVKIADKQDALPGEIVEFTLRFDNVGNVKVGNVTLIDHLSPRLELVEGSPECNIPADFFLDTQNTSTQIFRCEIKDPLEAGKGGVVRFKCKVR